MKAYVPHVSEAVGEKLAIARDHVTLRDEDDRIFLRLGDAVKVRVGGRDEKRKRWKLALEKA